MATNGPLPDDLSADPMRRHVEQVAKSIRERTALMTEIGERTARIITEAVENYARQTETLMDFCQQTIDQCRSAAAQLEPLAGRPAQIDVDKMERELNAPAPIGRRQPMPSMPEPRR